MVSLQIALSTKEKDIGWLNTNISGGKSKKRKRDNVLDDGGDQAVAWELKLWCNDKKESSPPAAVRGIKLNLEDSPLPPEWQRCLDMKSGRVHFYNTRTHRRTARDPRRSPSRGIGLDLDLNVGCEFHMPNKETGDEQQQGREKKQELGGLTRDSELVSAEEDPREMVAAVCVRCHMLVMMCKSIPSCPNCKYLHQLADPAAPKDMSGFRLLSCKEQ